MIRARIETASRDELTDLQLERLRRTVRRVLDRVPAGGVVQPRTVFDRVWTPLFSYKRKLVDSPGCLKFPNTFRQVN